MGSTPAEHTMKTISEIMLRCWFYMACHCKFIPTRCYVKLWKDNKFHIGCTDEKKQYLIKVKQLKLKEFFDNPPKKYIKNKERALKFINSYKGTYEQRHYDGLFQAIGNFSSGK